MQKNLYFTRFLLMQQFKIFMILSVISSAFGAEIKYAGSNKTDAFEYQLRVEREAETVNMPVIDNILKHQCPNDFQFMVSSMVKDHKSARGLPPISLLYGEPGIGKSTLACGIAAKTKMACIFIKCSELGTTYQNSASVNLGRYMQEAIDSKHPYIVVLDEIGSILEYSKNNPKLNEDATKAFLTITDELRKKNPYARIIATTNTFDTFAQPAQNRFAHKFAIYSPRDADGYKDMIRLFIGQLNIACDDELLSLMAKRTMGYSTRTVEAIVHTAGVFAGMRSNSIGNVTLLAEDFFSALKRVNAPVPLYTTLKSFFTTISPHIIPALSLGFSVYSFYKQQEQFEFNKNMANQHLVLAQKGLQLGVGSFMLGVMGYKLSKQNTQISVQSYELAKENLRMSAESMVSHGALVRWPSYGPELIPPTARKVGENYVEQLKKDRYLD